MPLLLEKNSFEKLLGFFFKAKSDGKEKQFISKIHHQNPKVADAFSKFDDVIVDRYRMLKNTLQSRGMDTSELDDFMDQYYN